MMHDTHDAEGVSLLSEKHVGPDHPDHYQPTQDHVSSNHKQSKKRSRLLLGVLSCLSLIFAFFLGAAVSRPLFGDPFDPSLQVFSPAKDAVEYIPVRFNRSRGADKTPYQGWPSKEVDRLWSSLYSGSMLSVIDANTASHLPDATARLPFEGRENEFALALGVFHHLHCLDSIRMALYPDYYDESFYLPNGTIDHCKWVHIDHCLDQIRQILMCNADLNVVRFTWSDIVQGLRPHTDNSHTCRNFDKLQEWARERRPGRNVWDPSKRVLEGPDGKFNIEQGRNYALEGEGECDGI